MIGVIKVDVFPAVIATGRAFCNRQNQRKILKNQIDNGIHTVIMAPRRYGKTSLINQVLIERKYPYALMELLMVNSAEDLESLILEKVSTLISDIIPNTTRARNTILKVFQFLSPEFILSAVGQKIVFRPNRQDQKPVARIAEVLKSLDEIATKMKKRVVVVMDEFQEIHELEGIKVEASIRHAMQYSQSVTYIFSGSNRHLLENMFNDKNRPFYNSCEIMRLSRIKSEEYQKFIKQKAKSKWNLVLDEHVIEEILRLTQNHPAYVNHLCRYFWLINQVPTVAKVKLYWERYVFSRHNDFTENYLRLSMNQRKLLRFIANNKVVQPSSQPVSMKLQLSESSIRQALKELVSKDLIFKCKDIWRVLDPAFGAFLA